MTITTSFGRGRNVQSWTEGVDSCVAEAGKCWLGGCAVIRLEERGVNSSVTESRTDKPQGDAEAIGVASHLVQGQKCLSLTRPVPDLCSIPDVHSQDRSHN